VLKAGKQTEVNILIETARGGGGGERITYLAFELLRKTSRT